MRIANQLTMHGFMLIMSLLAHTPAFAMDVSVLSYGAVGDGATNDRAAIQSAISDVNVNGGGTVTIPYRASCSNSNGVCNMFLSGNLTLMSNVALTISTGATLKQSQSSADYTYTPILGHTTGSGISGDIAVFLNLPFIYGPSGTTNIAVNGGGTIQLTTASGGNSTTIQTGAIGFYSVSGYTIQNVSILGSHQYNILLFTTSNGTVSGVTINTAHSGEFNDDGISIQNSQNVHITGNNIGSTDDDGVYIWASYNDRRGNTAGGLSNRWWSSASPQPSTSIEIDHNSITSGGGVLIPWCAAAPDPSQVEIAGVKIHDNTIKVNAYATYAVHCWCDSGYYDEPAQYRSGAFPEEMSTSPVRDVTFAGNSYTGSVTFPWDLGTNIVTDFPNPNPNPGGASSETVLNGGFESGGASYWSSQGARGTDVGAYNAAIGQDGSWYGYIQGFSQGYTALYQGIRLISGQTYTLKALVQSSGRSFRLIAYNTCTSTGWSTNFSNTSWQTVSLTFTANSSCGNYHVGIDNGNGYSAGDWAHIDDMTINSAIDSHNPMVTYSHGGGNIWVRYANTGDYDTYHKSSQNVGEYFLVPFIGTQAALLGCTYSGLGSGDISIDAGPATNVSWSTASTTTQYPVYTTPVLSYGRHVLKVSVHGNGYIDFDALRVTP